jgi:hypothetical protein
MSREKRSDAAWPCFLGLVALELALATVAAVGSCSSCGRAPIGAVPLAAWAGIAWYGAILLAGLAGARRAAFWGALVAAGAHVALVATLVSSGRYCTPCFIAGAAAVGLVIATLKADGENFGRLAKAMAAGAILAQVALVGGPLLEKRAVEGVLMQEEARESGVVRLVVFERADCPYCDTFERDVLPAAERAVGRLDVERRDASDRPELPTPTVVVSGAGGREVFPGLPTVEMLVEAVRSARGSSASGSASRGSASSLAEKKP